MLSLVLKARNSSGCQNLFFDRDDDGTIRPTLVGRHEGREIQIDFDDLTDSDIDDLIAFLKRRRGE